MSTKEIIEKEIGEGYHISEPNKQWVSADDAVSKKKIREKIKGYVELRRYLGNQAKQDLKMKIDALNELLED